LAEQFENQVENDLVMAFRLIVEFVGNASKKRFQAVREGFRFSGLYFL